MMEERCDEGTEVRWKLMLFPMQIYNKAIAEADKGPHVASN